MVFYRINCHVDAETVPYYNLKFLECYPFSGKFSGEYPDFIALYV